MPNYPVSNLISEVRKALDENAAAATLFTEGIETLPLDDIITQKLPEAARIIVQKAPRHMVDFHGTFGGPITWDFNKNYGYIALPANFLRFGVFKMSNWAGPVALAISDTDPRYFIQSARFEGIRASVYRPLCAITMIEGTKVLQFFGTIRGDEATIQTGKYEPVPIIDNNTLTISAWLRSPVIYYAAGLTASTIGQDKAAQNLLSIANEFITG